MVVRGVPGGFCWCVVLTGFGVAMSDPKLQINEQRKKAPPLCRTDVVKGSCVFGRAYSTHVVASIEACCDLCGPDPNCVAWNLNGNSTIMHCALKNASSVGKRGGSCLANGMIDPPPSPGPPPPGNFSVAMDTFKLPHGWLCGANSSTQIYYPTLLDKGPFPILSFGHGSGGSMLMPLQKAVASLGFIIVAPKTGCCNSAGDDMLGALAWSRSNASLHKALGHVDWTRAGIYGHSFGSAWATDAVRKAEKQPDVYNVKAALFSHGGHNASAITVPSMFTSGRGGGAGTDMFDSSPAKFKVYAVAKGAGHMEPIQGRRLNGFDGHFLGCHVAGLQTSCAKIYGDGPDSICKAQPMDACKVVQPK